MWVLIFSDDRYLNKPDECIRELTKKRKVLLSNLNCKLILLLNTHVPTYVLVCWYLIPTRVQSLPMTLLVGVVLVSRWSS